MTEEKIITEFKEKVDLEKKLFKELESLSNNLSRTTDPKDIKMVNSQISKIQNSLNKVNSEIPDIIDKTPLIKPLKVQEVSKENVKRVVKKKTRPLRRIRSFTKRNLERLEKRTLKRIKKRE